jgi:hypothetical protein
MKRHFPGLHAEAARTNDFLEGIKREVERHLTGQETEPWEILYFKMYKSQLAVIEQALETASLTLSGQKARGYYLEMICVDFLAGATLGETDSTPFLSSVYCLLEFLPKPKRIELAERLKETA